MAGRQQQPYLIIRFTAEAQSSQRIKIFVKLHNKNIASRYSVLSPHYSVLFNPGPFFKAFDNGIHTGSAGAFYQNPVAGTQRILQRI